MKTANQPTNPKGSTEMPTYDVSAREITYLTFVVEADTPEQALEKAKEQYKEGFALIGDTELDTETLDVCGEYGETS